MKNINIIVPVYADWSSLKLNIKSLSKIYGNNSKINIYYINDCGPEADFLEVKIRDSIKYLTNFHYYKNKVNLGFVKSNNNAVRNIINKTGDILLLNSDTKVTKGFLEEMVRVLYSDDNIGIVNPRSNNATIWSVPMNGSLADKPAKSYSYWKRLIKQIPEKYISPTSHGFCMLIRRDIVDKIDLFDEIYGKGYGEENDFTMRARGYGWECAVANRAFVFHYESKSFGDEARLVLSKKNRKILDKRYPDYSKLLDNYLVSINEGLVKKESVLWKITRKVYRGLEYTHENGYRAASKKLIKYIDKRLISKISKNKYKNTPAIKVWSNELTNSGAPLVLLSVLTDLAGEIPNDMKIELYHPVGCRIDNSFTSRVADLGIKIKVDETIVRNFSKGDIVLINSSGYSIQLYDNILNNLEDGTIKHLFFYIHEDNPYWTGMDNPVFNTIKIRFRNMIDKNKITVYTPSVKTMQNWIGYFETDNNFKVMPGRVNIEKDDIKPKSKEDFDKIQFVVSGTVEPRKMQLSILGAFDCFYDFYYSKSPNNYRDWEINIIGSYANEPANIYNNNVKKYNNKYNGRIHVYNKMSSKDALDIVKSSNISIMYSTDESFGMVIIEGMAFGHPIIRSEASGGEEQLNGGATGWSVNTENLSTLINSIEEILNRKNTPSSKLVKMSKESNKVARENIENDYLIIFDMINQINKN